MICNVIDRFECRQNVALSESRCSMQSFDDDRVNKLLFGLVGCDDALVSVAERNTGN